ncbi:MAG: hypothetical protein Q9186_006031 [Xanthomendoza sp. 1 TL-2023]
MCHRFHYSAKPLDLVGAFVMLRPMILRFAVARTARQQLILQRRAFSIPNSSLRGMKTHKTKSQITDLYGVPGDLVQDLYLRELRAYKPPPLKPSDSEGHVQTFSPPRAPQSPDEGDMARDLKAYEDQLVEVEGQAAPGEAGAPEENWFEEEDDEDEEHGATAH